MDFANFCTAIKSCNVYLLLALLDYSLLFSHELFIPLKKKKKNLHNSEFCSTINSTPPACKTILSEAVTSRQTH